MSICIVAFILWLNIEPQGRALGTPKGSTIEESRELPLTLKLADEPAEQEHGLSDRESMAQDHGMLFAFPTPNITGFWMKDMHFALDIVWLDADKVIVQIDENVKPETYPEIIFRPQVPVKYVLEINAGVAGELGLYVGQKLNFGRILE
ncbi:MAG TPA: DUF192 domain-containing protein [Candidatus Paceibacterota bacterium]